MSLSLSTISSRMLLLAASACSFSAVADAHATQDGARDPAYHAVVSRQGVPVRSGASDNYYAFGALDEGAIVAVIEEKFGWARIATDGPDFASFYGYVKEEEVKVDADGRRGVALGRVQVFAPNLERDGDPDASWKWITRIEAERPLVVLGAVAGENGGYYKIALPATGEGWVSLNFLRKATDAEVNAWRARARAAEAAPNTETQPPAGEAQPPVQIIDEPMGPPAPPANSHADPAVEADEEAPIDTVASEDASEMTTDNSDDAAASAAEAAGPEEIEEEIEEAPEVTPAMQVRKTFEALEWAYEALKQEPVRTAEIDPLRQRYLELLEQALLEERDTVIARGRVQLLDARLKLQERLLEVDRVRQAADESAAAQERARIALEFAANYVAVGEVAVSTIYDGKRLPELLRLMDPATGRTIAYLQPDDEFQFAEKVGMLVGIVGEKQYDGGLRLHVIQPRRVDLLQTVKQTDVASANPTGE